MLVGKQSLLLIFTYNLHRILEIPSMLAKTRESTHKLASQNAETTILTDIYSYLQDEMNLLK